MAFNALAIAIGEPRSQDWFDEFRRRAPQRDIRLWPDRIGDPAEIAYVCHWSTPRKLMREFPNLKIMFSAAAGVDYLMGDPELPQVPLVRCVHPDLSMRMTEYIVLHVLMRHRKQQIYDAQQRERVWKPHEQAGANEVAVGLMGIGSIGAEAAKVLARIGFRVAGWSRTPKTLPGIETFHGPDGLDKFLARTEIVVSVLPLTPETRGLFNLALFRKLKRDGAAGGAFFINAARGRQQVDADILTALDEGTLAGATLDVFPMEPLAADSPLWSHPKVTITPHNAGDVGRDHLIGRVLEQLDNYERGLPLEDLVDRTRGY
jgi:glyoxylate/hydroxypyruvate reductase A